MHRRAISIHGKMYIVKRTIPESQLNLIDGYSNVLLTLYRAEIIFERDGLLYICDAVLDLDSVPIP